MDTSWINQSRNSEAYIQGVKVFMEFAKKGAQNGKVRCPCKSCQVGRKKVLPLEEVEKHILFKGFYKEYKDWIFHGPMTGSQKFSSQVGRMFEILDQSRSIGQDDIGGLLRDATVFNMPHMGEQISEPYEQLETTDNVMDDPDDPTEIPIELPNLFTLEEEAKFEKILDAANEPLYPVCISFFVLSFILHLLHLKCMFNWSNKSFSMLIDLLWDAFP